MYLIIKMLRSRVFAVSEFIIVALLLVSLPFGMPMSNFVMWLFFSPFTSLIIVGLIGDLRGW